MAVGLVSIRQVGNSLISNFTDGSHSIALPASPGLWFSRGSNNRSIRLVGEELVSYFGSGAVVSSRQTGRGVWLAKSSIDVSPAPPPPPPPPAYPAPVDDYPWPNGTVGDLSPLRYGYRECVDFVAWRINRDQGVTSSPWKWDWGNMRITNGDAIGWRPDWQTHGWPVDITPAQGTIGWYGSSAGALGHVNWVQSVSGSTVVLEEYNWGGNHAYNTRTVTIGGAGAPDHYLGQPPA